MNFIDQIRNQLAPAISSLSTQLGAGETATRTAVNTGVPALLAGLAGLTSTTDGAQKVAAAMGKVDPVTLPNQLSSNPGSVIEQGGNILGSLFGNATLNGIISALAKYTGLNAASAQKLLGYLMPMILGAIGSRFAGRQVTPQGLTSFFAEEQGTIANAVPPGFSLANIPGMPNVGSVLQPGAGTPGMPEQQGSPSMRWLIPALGIAALALVMFFVFRGPTLSVPSLDKVNTELTDTFKSINGTMTGITDVASAEAATRELKKMEGTLDTLKGQVKKLPEADKTKVMAQAKTKLEEIESQYAKVVWTPGVGEKIRSAMDGVMTQLAAISGQPVPKSAMLSGEVATAVTTLTETLNGIKDAPSATLAVTKLKEVDGKLDEAKAGFGKVGESTRTAIAAMVKSAVDKLRQLADKVMAMPGVGEKVKPILDAILVKLNSFAA